MNIYAADVLLEQTSQPTVTPGSVGGELATASTVSGTATLTFQAEDGGSGVYKAVVSVDGTPLGAMGLDSNGGRCADAGQTTDGLPAFLYLRPCAATVSADVPLDTTALANGTHHLVVSVTNAAGNPTVVLDRKIDVANSTTSPTPTPTGSGSGTSTTEAGTSTGTTTTTAGSSGPSGSSGTSTGSSSTATQLLGAPNGSPLAGEAVLSARWASTTNTTLTGRWGRSQKIVGRLLTPQGIPIAGAVVEATATPASQGRIARAVADPQTDGQGRFSLRLSPSSGSETVVLAYRAHKGDIVPLAAHTLALAVPASLTLRVAPRVSRQGATIFFHGLLHGGPLPAGGKQLILQARAPGSEWRTFDVVSTDARGRYRASYRFRLPGPIAYRFRAVSPHEADFPFATGRSNVVAVMER